MAFTMHSHSGQFCPGHAKDELEEVIKHAISLGYKTMGLTEHMPRTSLDDLYPEEMDDPEGSLAALFPRHQAYLEEAKRMQAKYADQIHLLIGFEGEWIRPEYEAVIRDLAADPAVDYFIGSLHHTCGVPIDFDREMYDDAAAKAVAVLSSSAAGPGGGAVVNGAGRAEEKSERALYAAYYDEQYEMLTALRPKVVGHFDLIRLLSVDPGRNVEQVWPEVWAKMVRNLKVVVGYGGWLECNSSALRKGLAEPYPARFVAEKYLEVGGKFTFSDDSHGTAQLSTNYMRALDYLESLGVRSVWTLERSPRSGVGGDQGAELIEKDVGLEIFRKGLKLDGGS